MLSAAVKIRVDLPWLKPEKKDTKKKKNNCKTFMLIFSVYEINIIICLSVKVIKNPAFCGMKKSILNY
jgi:hypothetical protein